MDPTRERFNSATTSSAQSSGSSQSAGSSISSRTECASRPKPEANNQITRRQSPGVPTSPLTLSGSCLENNNMVETAPDHGLTATQEHKSYQMSHFGLILVSPGMQQALAAVSKCGTVEPNASSGFGRGRFLLLIRPHLSISVAKTTGRGGCRGEKWLHPKQHLPWVSSPSPVAWLLPPPCPLC